MTKLLAKLRVCANCEWIFSEGMACPKCNFWSYGAHYEYGKRAYNYAKSQKPWKDKKLNWLSSELDKEIRETSQKKKGYL